MAYWVLGDAALTEDAVQKTFVQAWRAAETYDPARPLGAWLAAIARRAAIDIYRREQRHLHTQDVDLGDAELVTVPPSVGQINDLWKIRRALQDMPAEDRELIRLQHFDELTHTEIAHQLATPLGTVKSRSLHAHRRLASLLSHPRQAR